MKTVLNYIENNKEKFINDLFGFLRIPSISSNPENFQDMIKCSEYLISKLNDLGFKNIKILNKKGHPIVYGEKIIDKKKPTILVYGHYDVQPVDPIDLWSADPFDPYIKDGKIWGRGATDDKGQLFAYFKSLEAFQNTGVELPVNIKVIFEGEEEIGSESLPMTIKENRQLLQSDVVLISDTSLFDEKTPSITCSLRGLTYFQIDLEGPNRDLHSGTYGGAIHNPIEVLCNILTKMKDKNGKITIPHFYDDVIPLNKRDRDDYLKLKFNESKYKKDLGVKELFGEKGYTTPERASGRPTFEINGIWGGFTGKGAKTVLPSKASAKVSMRLVANQDPEKIKKYFEKYLKEIVPASVKIKVEYLHGGSPAFTSPDNIASKAAALAMEKAFGKYPVFTREGGSIPIVVDFMQQLKVPAVLMGFGLDSENAHSPNEHFDIGNFFKGIKATAYFFEEYEKLKNSQNAR